MTGSAARGAGRLSIGPRRGAGIFGMAPKRCQASLFGRYRLIWEAAGASKARNCPWRGAQHHNRLRLLAWSGREHTLGLGYSGTIYTRNPRRKSCNGHSCKDSAYRIFALPRIAAHNLRCTSRSSRSDLGHKTRPRTAHPWYKFAWAHP